MPTIAAVILQRSGCVEKVKSSELSPFHRRYNKPFANRLGLGFECDSGRVRRGNSRCGSNQLSEPFPGNLTQPMVSPSEH